MDNFDLTKFLAEGKLHEAMSPQDVVDIADTVAEEFTIESAEEGDFLVYSVGKMDADNMSFELDTDLTSQSPKDIDTRGVGEGWGGIFRIKPTEDGYEVRNAEKGGLVAMIDGTGNFKMLSADESRAEMGLEENKEETKSNKMKKSELKEMIKAAMLAEVEISEDVDMIPAEKLFALIARDLEFSPLAQDNVMLSKEDAIEIMRHVIAIEQSDISPEAALGEYIANGEFEEAGDIPGFEGTKDALDKLGLEEAEEEDVEDVEIDTEEEVDVDMEMDSDVEGIDVKQDADAELSGTVGDVQDNLEAALEAARKLGDEKLEDQIGNTLTFFTRAHVVKEDMLEDEAEMGLEEIKNSPELDKAKEDYMAGKISLADYQAIVKKLDFKGVKDAEAKAQAKADAIAAEKKELEDKKAKVKQAEEDRKAGKISQEEFAKIAQANQYVNKESLNESITFPMWNKIK